MARRQEQRQYSLKQQLYRFIITLLLVCLALVMASFLFSLSILNRSQSLFTSQGLLSTYYQRVDGMDTVARSYLYSDNPEEYRQYQQLRLQASEALAKLAETTPVLAFRSSRLENMLTTYQERMDAYHEGKGDRFITYNDLHYLGQLIGRTATAYQQLIGDQMQQEIKVQQQRWVWQVSLAVVGILGMAGICLMFGSYYIKKIAAPMTAMVENLRQIEAGDYTLADIKSNTSEFALMSDALERMSVAVAQNVAHLQKASALEKRLLEQENENLIIKNQLTDAQLKTLQLQINPHFLFNTLSMISNQAYMGGDSQTSEAMEDLSRVLRYALDKTNRIATIREEAAGVAYYIRLQQRRFAGRVQFVTDIEDNLPPLMIPAVILQPLIENALMHGVANQMEDARVTLKIHRFEERLHIHVEDNGCGIEPDALEALLARIQEGFYDQELEDRGSVGLRNVYRRVYMYFGEDMQFSIESDPGVGTIVTMDLPLV